MILPREPDEQEICKHNTLVIKLHYYHVEKGVLGKFRLALPGDVISSKKILREGNHEPNTFVLT